MSTVRPPATGKPHVDERPAEGAGVPERTADGRYLVIGGRRWRATDPSIPEPLRAELVAELMDARRTVGAGRRAGDDAAVVAARCRVHDAKVALGERGQPWSIRSPERDGPTV